MSILRSARSAGFLIRLWVPGGRREKRAVSAKVELCVLLPLAVWTVGARAPSALWCESRPGPGGKSEGSTDKRERDRGWKAPGCCSLRGSVATAAKHLIKNPELRSPSVKMDVFPSEKQNYVKAVVHGSSGLSGGPKLTASGAPRGSQGGGDGSTHSCRLAEWTCKPGLPCVRPNTLGTWQTSPPGPQSAGLRLHHPQRAERAASLNQAWKVDLGAGR